MEQPPWSFDDLQPEDLSTSSIPNVLDLTRNGSLNVKPCHACHVHSADWLPNSALASTQTTASSQQSADPIQPDNALSHTTVTLSYVSTSPINSASQPRTGLPPICKFSLLPSCEAEKGLRESTYTLNQHYLEHCDTPVDLVTKTPEVDRLCLPREICERNGTAGSSTTSGEERGIPESAETSGRDDSWSSVGVVSLETDMTVLRTGISETLLQVSKKEEAVQNKEAAIELGFLTGECQSPLEEPVCPSATSPCDLEEVLMLPQASAPPSRDNSFPADEAGSIAEGARLDSSDENGHPRRPQPEPLTEDVCPSGISEDKANALTAHERVNGNVSAPQERKLPLRSNRGVRLQSLVMTINSSSYKVSGRVDTNADASKTGDSYAMNPKKTGTLSNGKSRSKAKAKHKVVTPRKKAEANGIPMHQCKTTTSDCVVPSKKSNSKFTKAMAEEVPNPGHLPQVRSECSSPVSRNSQKEPDLVHSDPPSLEKKQARCSPPAAPKKSPCSPKDPPRSSAAKKKVARTPKKRRKKRPPAPYFSIFAPKEPEIKLRYVHYKEEKKEPRYHHFSPFVRLHGQQASTSQCTVVNYPEEVATQAKKGPREQQEDHHSSFLSGTVPNTSCLRLGRASTQGQRRGALICCLCALSANAMDLGDLHGPYYPEGQRVSRAKTSTLGSDLKERKNDDSDSDSSSCSVGGRGKKRAANQWWRKGLPPTDDGPAAAAAKRARSQMWPADVEDWYSAPVLPMEPREYWLHEDCAIWSAGVFLVKGRVYGLEETVKVARQTTCSACSGPGATLGCFFKGCPNKYHYRCALEADCVLVEENFSMKCKKHKNKTLKAPAGGMHSDPRRKRAS
ncbi:transcription factor 20 [Syngnathus typhle]|uniref:transcription factor 20 n=1 Tax=Syngnathus typhle TaxID=161592 RepID=UPI002A6A4E89|nr:transcription factor 20 [Syngnathus typhle]XP_061160859.1 transcription factor 20 [Syngnathus typhle]